MALSPASVVLQPETYFRLVVVFVVGPARSSCAPFPSIYLPSWLGHGLHQLGGATEGLAVWVRRCERGGVVLVGAAVWAR